VREEECSKRDNANVVQTRYASLITLSVLSLSLERERGTNLGWAILLLLQSQNKKSNRPKQTKSIQSSQRRKRQKHNMHSIIKQATEKMTKIILPFIVLAGMFTIILISFLVTWATLLLYFKVDDLIKSKKQQTQTESLVTKNKEAKGQQRFKRQKHNVHFMFKPCIVDIIFLLECFLYA